MMRLEPGGGSSNAAKCCILTAIVIAVTILLFAMFFRVSVVPAGHIGVKDTFGNVADNYYTAGLVFRTPWVQVHTMSVQTQCRHINVSCPSKEGLSIGLEGNIFYRLDPTKAVQLYKTVGITYDTVIMEPTALSLVRKLTAMHEVKDLYSDQRAGLEAALLKELATDMEKRGIIIEGTPFQRIILPPKLLASIEEKLRMEQEGMRMDFVLAKERKEAERKKVEASGIADFQAIVSKGIDSNLLKWKGIEATERLAMSPNSKIVIIGAGEGGLPVILNSDTPKEVSENYVTSKPKDQRTVEITLQDNPLVRDTREKPGSTV